MKIDPDVIRLLLLDKCSSHTKKSVIDSIEVGEDSIDFIPAGCTSLVQPLDLVINKPFKDKLKDFFEKWLSETGIKETNKTKKGYVKAPSSILVLKWIKEAWCQINSDLVVKSFKYAGNVSHCFYNIY